MTFKEALTTCFNKYADFSGRARRSEFWYFMLFNCAALTILYTLLGDSSIFSIASVALAVPSLAVGWRRLHDIGKSGLWYLACLVPILNIYLIVLLCKDSQPGANEFGPNPKSVNDGAQFVPTPQGSQIPDYAKPVDFEQPAEQPVSQPATMPAAQPMPQPAVQPVAQPTPQPSAEVPKKPVEESPFAAFIKKEEEKVSNAAAEVQEAFDEMKAQEPDIIQQTVHNMYHPQQQEVKIDEPVPVSYDMGNIYDDVAKCPKCGAELKAGDKFCNVCGAKL